MAKIDRIYAVVDDFGLITSAEAAELGMSNAELVQQAVRGKLTRVSRGVYRLPIWPFQKEAPYAIAVKAAGEGSFLYGESVIALLELAPTDPSKLWIAAPKRTRRNLGNGVRIIRLDNATPEYIEGIPCQPVKEALISAIPTIGGKRAEQAADEALRRELITKAEAEAVKERCKPYEEAKQFEAPR